MSFPVAPCGILSRFERYWASYKRGIIRVTGNTVVTEIPRRRQRGVIYHGNSLVWSMCSLSYYLVYLLEHFNLSPLYHSMYLLLKLEVISLLDPITLPLYSTWWRFHSSQSDDVTPMPNLMASPLYLTLRHPSTQPDVTSLPNLMTSPLFPTWRHPST